MDISPILTKLEREKGLVLKDYRDGTLIRRIERRMKYDGANSLDEYIQMIDGDHHLYWRLVSDLFIGVTDFFRDPEVWKMVKEEVLPQLSAISNQLSAGSQRLKAEGREPRASLRIWSAGCSTGEETYSLAIMLNEFMIKNLVSVPVKIHGTDIMEDKLEVARKGAYSEDKIAKVEEKLRGRYFTKLSAFSCRLSAVSQKSEAESRELKADSLCVRDTLRDTIQFRQFDLVRPKLMPLFDMIVCRNVLIYFQQHLQEQVIEFFHKSLKPNGILWLGMTESLWGKASELFEPVCLRERVFRRKQ